MPAPLDRGRTRKRRTAPVDKKGAGEFRKAAAFKRTPVYKQQVRRIYDEAPPKQKEVLRRAAQRRDTPEAKVIRERAKQVGTEARDIKAKADLRRGAREARRNIALAKLAQGAKRGTNKMGLEAPVLKVLEQTTRPIHGIAGATRAGIRGENIPKAALRGVRNKDKFLFSDVLKQLGAPKVVQSAGGLVLDVGLDPATYLTGGTSVVAKTTAKSVAKKAAKQAPTPVRKATPKEARRVEARATGGGAAAPKLSERAHARAMRTGDQSRGVSVRFAGKEIPGVTRATAKATRGARKVARKVPGARPTKGAARHLAADVNPNVVPEGLTRGEHAEIRQATRTARHTASRETHKARQTAQALQKAIGKDNYTRVLDAIEAGRINALPPNLRAPARLLRDRFRFIRRIEKQAGIKGATRKNYVTHLRADLLAEGKGVGVSGVGKRTVTPSSSKARQGQGTLAELRKTQPGKYVQDPGVLYAARMQEGARSIAQANLNRRLADMGRTVRKGQEINLKPHEAIYHIKGSNIAKLDRKKDAAQIQRLVDEGGKSGRYVILNDQAVERALKTIVPAGDRSSYGLAFDRFQGTWKLIATQPNPGFHIRNFFGDMQNAYLATSGRRLPRNVGQAAKTLKAVSREERALKTVGATPKPTKGKISTPRYGEVSYDTLGKELAKAGALRSGFAARELHDLFDAGINGTGTRIQRLRRWSNNREDIFRAATAIEGLKRGLTYEQAAARASRYHFDYSDLTELERKVLRRVMPFYTFSARNIPLQFKSLITRPGKFAQYQKIREEFAKHFGIDLDQAERDSPEREQRSAPVYVKIGGKTVAISLGPSGLPLTDLNEFPTSLNPAKLADEWMNRAVSLLTPAVKTPVELWSNMSFFFRDQIERDEGPLVPAPAWVAGIPEKFRRDLGVVPDYVDKRTGKKQWGWPAKVAYAVSVLPGPLNFANRVMTPSERAGQSTTNKVVGYVGLRASEVDPISTRVTDLYEEKRKIGKKIAALNQRGVKADRATPEYRALRARETELEREIWKLRRKRGDKHLPAAGAPPKRGTKWPSTGGIKWSDKSSGITWGE